MKGGWQSEKEKILKYMAIPAQKKLEWLYQMNRFINKFTSSQNKEIRRKLRQKQNF